MVMYIIIDNHLGYVEMHVIYVPSYGTPLPSSSSITAFSKRLFSPGDRTDDVFSSLQGVLESGGRFPGMVHVGPHLQGQSFGSV